VAERDTTPGTRPDSRQTAGLLAFFLIGILVCVLNADTDGTVAALAAMALITFMHLPVKWHPYTRAYRGLFSGGAVLIVGTMLDIVWVQALGWTIAWYFWTRHNIAQSAIPLSRSWVAWLFVFPWVTHDFPEIGWWFRLSGADISEWVFSLLGYPVFKEGTRLLIAGLPVNVEAACAGMGILQSLLVGGIILLLLYFPRGHGFYLLLPLVPLLAWLSNSFRIVLITAVALSEGVQFSQGLFHTWGAIVVILIMLTLTLILLSLLRLSFPRLAGE